MDYGSSSSYWSDDGDGDVGVSSGGDRNLHTNRVSPPPSSSRQRRRNLNRHDNNYQLKRPRNFQRFLTTPVLAHLTKLEQKQMDGPLYTKVTQFLFSEIAFESMLGQGRCTMVHQVRIRSMASEKRFALKSLNATRVKQYASETNTRSENESQHASQVLAASAEELYREATVLARCHHPNIIRLQGVAIEGLVGSLNMNMDPSDALSVARAEYGYFLVLDRINETLEQRLPKWRQYQKRRFPLMRRRSTSTSGQSRSRSIQKSLSTNTMERGTSSGEEEKQQQQRQQEEESNGDLPERMVIATSIASAVSYLHKKLGIVVRDLCPESIGFDAWTGQVKLFDLGLARSPEECYMDIRIDGNFRYMAPEIMLCQPSGLPGDIYSFGVLLWELVTLERPFDAFFIPDRTSSRRKEIFAQSKFTEQVILNNEWRPNCSNISDPEAKRLIQECWCSDPEARPNAEQVFWRLDQSIVLRQQVKKQRRISFKGGFRRASFQSTSRGSGGRPASSGATPKRRASGLLRPFSRGSKADSRQSGRDPQRLSEMEEAAAKVAADFEEDDSHSSGSLRLEPQVPGEQDNSSMTRTTQNYTMMTEPPVRPSIPVKNSEADTEAEKDIGPPSLSLADFRSRLKVSKKERKPLERSISAPASTLSQEPQAPTSTISLDKVTKSKAKNSSQSDEFYSTPGAYSSKGPPPSLLSPDHQKKIPAKSINSGGYWTKASSDRTSSGGREKGSKGGLGNKLRQFLSSKASQSSETAIAEDSDTRNRRSSSVGQ